MKKSKIEERHLTEREKWIYAERMKRKSMSEIQGYLIAYIIATDNSDMLKRADEERISELEEQTGYKFDKVARSFAETRLKQMYRDREKSIVRR